MEEPYKFEVVILKQYNPNYGNNRECICGCTYAQHFTPWCEVSTTHNGCDNFIELPPGQITPDDAREQGKKDKQEGREFNSFYSTVNIFVRDAYQKGYEKGTTSVEELLQELSECMGDDFNVIANEDDGDYLKFGDEDPWNDLTL